MDAVGVAGRERSRYHLARRVPETSRLRTTLDWLFVLALIAAGGRLLLWRSAMLSEIGGAGWALFVVETVTVAWMVSTAALFAGRSQPPKTAPEPDPFTTLDVLIPVAGEPVEMVAATIAAAKAIQWPVNIIVCNDGWMAGKANWRDIELLCRHMGVHCLTRRTGPKGKAGNLNYALARVQADAVLTIDADHRVVSDVAQQMLGWLRYEDVAFVTTPQDFVDARRDNLNPTEPVFYRATQPARDKHGIAFSTGNGVLYRREAVIRIGGFSEWSVVEDLHTSIRLHSAGWKSVFWPRPVSVGIAPKTAAEYAKQRLRWAVDSMRILRYDPPWRRKELSRRAKLHYTHTLVSYLTTMLQVGFLLAPPAWILGRFTLLTDVDWQEQALYIGPWLAVAVVTLSRWAGPRAAWRSIRLTTAFLPIVFWAAAWGTFRPKNSRGTVTSKSNQPRFNRLVLAGMLLPLGLLGTLVWGVFDTRDGGSDLAMAWGALLLIVAIGPLLRVGYRRFWPGVTQVTVIALATALAGGAVATTRFGWEAPGGLYSSFVVDPTFATAVVEINDFGERVITGPPIAAPADDDDDDDDAVDASDVAAAPDPALVQLAEGDGIYTGFTSDPLPYDLSDVERWSLRVTEPQIVHWYQQWGSGEARFRGDWLAEMADAGRVPMISWEAWARPDGSFSSPEQEFGDMAAIAAGEHDEYINSWAEAAAEYGDPILLRPFHEMNGFWYPWSVDFNGRVVNGNSVDDFIAGWRHVVDRFRAAGADNVSFVWSINTLESFEQGEGVEALYPGDDYVDWVGTSGFNWDDYNPEWSSWVTAERVFADTYDVLSSFDKPIMFAEIGTATNTGDGVDWVAEAMEWFSTLDELRAIVWFDRSYDGNVDFRLQAEQQVALDRGVRAFDRFQPPLQFREVG